MRVSLAAGIKIQRQKGKEALGTGTWESLFSWSGQSVVNSRLTLHLESAVLAYLDVDDSVHRGAALWAAFPGDDPDSIAALETGWATTTRYLCQSAWLHGSSISRAPYRHGGDAFSIAQVGVGNGGLVGRCVMAHDMKYRRVGDGVQGAIAASDNQRRAKTESWQ